MKQQVHSQPGSPRKVKPKAKPAVKDESKKVKNVALETDFDQEEEDKKTPRAIPRDPAQPLPLPADGGPGVMFYNVIENEFVPKKDKEFKNDYD